MIPASILSPAAMAGFVFGLGLIFSLGPQNLMLIQAGLRRSHSFAVASTGYLSEIALVALGIGGLGTILAYHPTLSGLLQAGCAVFLAWWGARTLLSLRRATTGATASSAGDSRRAAIGAMLAVTWLNPLVWLEAMFLVGVLSSSYASDQQLGFATGFLLASAVKFYGWSLVGFGLSRRFGHPRAHRWMKTVTGLVLIAVSILLAGNILFG